MGKERIKLFLVDTTDPDRPTFYVLVRSFEIAVESIIEELKTKSGFQHPDKPFRITGIRFPAEDVLLVDLDIAGKF